jgi:hypothetical protein
VPYSNAYLAAFTIVDDLSHQARQDLGTWDLETLSDPHVDGNGSVNGKMSQYLGLFL